MTKDELKLAFQKAFQMGQDYWYHADHEFESYNKKSDAIRAKFNEMVEETIKDALAQPEQEPVAFDVQKALRRAYHLGQSYWADADSESYAANKRSDKHRQNFDELCEEALAYTTPPQRTWVGLTDEEMQDLWDRYAHMEMMRAIEAKLKEKNFD